MRKTRLLTVALVLLMIMGGTAGCSDSLQSWLPSTNSSEPPLIRVQIQFTDQRETVCYVKSLGIEESAEVYSGGPSRNYMYDRDGNITGSFNYQHVLYMSILPDETSTD